ncbi:hypothetical protein T03_13370 [Trichinella britovi]|uniref:Uncharacterized protein n=1 Tax=Trichinella britovi TaxID=45882 RepID=A0A0V1C787_TRIBR|nr:hypothetical protein T03_13370 [Trichinella britovi]
MTVATARILDPSSPNARLREACFSCGDTAILDQLWRNSSSVRFKNEWPDGKVNYTRWPFRIR